MEIALVGHLCDGHRQRSDLRINSNMTFLNTSWRSGWRSLGEVLQSQRIPHTLNFWRFGIRYLLHGRHEEDLR